MSELSGLTKYGFKAKDFHQIKDELESELRRNVDPSLRFTPDSITGQITAIIANQSRQVWEMAAGLFASLDANTAHGRALDALCALTGTYRRQAQCSRVRVLVRLAGGAMLPKGTIAALSNNANARFRTVDEVKNDSSKEAVIEVEMVADEAGPIYAKALSGWDKVTRQAGWLGITNQKDAVLGCLEENDEKLRLRRLNELRTVGSATHDALLEHVSKVSGVQAIHIEDGQHSFTTYVMGGDELEICEALWQHKPLGIATAGDITHSVTASNQQKYPISFSRPKLIVLSLHLNLRVRAVLNNDERAALKAKIIEYTQNNIKLGDDPYPSRLYGVLFNEPKILDVMSLTLRPNDSAAPIPLVIKAHELASFDENLIFIEQVVT